MIDDAERVQALAQYLLRESYATSDMDAVLTALGMLAELAGEHGAGGAPLDPGALMNARVNARGFPDAGPSPSGRPTVTRTGAPYGV